MCSSDLQTPHPKPQTPNPKPQTPGYIVEVQKVKMSWGGSSKGITGAKFQKSNHSGNSGHAFENSQQTINIQDRHQFESSNPFEEGAQEYSTRQYRLINEDISRSTMTRVRF